MSSPEVDTVTITSIDDSDSINIPQPSTLPLVELEPTMPALKPEITIPSNTHQATNPMESQPSTSGASSPAADDPTVVAGSSKETTPEASTSDATGGDEKKDESIFECNICLDTAKDAVVSMCGHLFCWPCLHQWLETRPRRQLCPVCKAAVSKDKVIPLYGRGSTNQQDPRTKVPPRPAGQRTEPEQGGFQGFGLMDGGFHMSFGIGAFPLGYLSSSFNFDGRRGNRGTMQWIWAFT